MTMQKEKKFTVRVCEDYVLREPGNVTMVLDRVSRIIINSYRLKNKHIVENVKGERHEICMENN